MVYASIGMVMGAGAGGGGGTSNYNGLTNKPQIGGRTLQGDKTADNLNLLDKNSNQTMTGKTMNADDNSILNLTLGNFKSGVIRATLSPTPSDTNLLTEKGTNDIVKVAGHGLNLSMDTNYIMTIELLDKEENVIDTKTLNLPLESMVVGGTYDDTTKKIILTLQGGSTVEIPVSDLINGLVSDSRKIGSHDLKNDITADNIYNDIKDKIENYKQVSTFTGITGSTKTLYFLDTTITGYEKGLYIYNGTDYKSVSSSGFQYQTMPTADAASLGKIIQYTGVTTAQYTHGYFYECIFKNDTYFWQNIEIQPVSVPEDLSSTIANISYNKTNLTFNTNKCRCMNGLTFIRQDIDLKSAMTDYTSERKKLMELPPLPTGYEYPDKMYITLLKPAGQMTCMENKVAFFDPLGDEYINPNVGVGTKFHMKSYVPVEDAHDSNGNPILIVEQLHNPQSGAAIIDETTGKPSCLKEQVVVEQGILDNPKVYILSNQVGQGYHYIDKYYKTGGEVVNGDFYEIEELEIEIDTSYLYKCYLAQQMQYKLGTFIVDENGKIGTYQIEEHASSQLVEAGEETSLNVKFSHGFKGTVTFVPTVQVSAYSMVEGLIQSGTLTINGGNTLESFHFSEVL